MMVTKIYTIFGKNDPVPPKYWFYESVMLSVYAKHSAIYMLSKERVPALMQGNVYLSKIEKSCHCQELVSHPMPVCS